ncbi:transposase domain-containing protein [Pseudomonas sp. A1437]|uniref:transposase domain-containing protein n=1 Tax=unclassified Pseudomonas TaxID=196821 RepID=UPI003784DCB2
MSLIKSARLSEIDPSDYLKGVLTRLPSQRASETTDLLPHNWCGHLTAYIQCGNLRRNAKMLNPARL